MHPHIALHEAYVRGDLEAVREFYDDPDFPNCRGPRGVGEIVLEYAIYWSPLPFIRRLLELGVEVNYSDHAGFPCLIAALSTTRADKLELLELLLARGADIEQRGHNDYTPLHWAAGHGDTESLELLLRCGADVNARTRIDEYETPLEVAERAGQRDAAERLRRRSPNS